MRPKPLTPDRALRPKRFSAADNALRDALERLDPEGVAEALFDGAEPDTLDGEGRPPLHWLISRIDDLENGKGAGFPGLDDAATDERAAACVDVLARWGADPDSWRSVTRDPDRLAVCARRENDCLGCEFDAGPGVGDPCAQSYIAGILAAYAKHERFQRTFETYRGWLERLPEAGSPRHKQVLAERRERLDAERQRRALWKEGAAGESEKASSSTTL